jgi:hypothetical protein
MCVARVRDRTGRWRTLLRHAIDGEAFEEYEEIWRERIEPGHDPVIEALRQDSSDNPDRHEASKQRASIPAPAYRRGRARVGFVNSIRRQISGDSMTEFSGSNAIRLAGRRRLARMTSLMAKIRKWLGMGKKA